MTFHSLPSPLRPLLKHCYNSIETSAIVLVKCVTVNGHKYKVGCMFVCHVTPTEEIPMFINVKHIINLQHDWLICGPIYHAACFNKHSHAYEVDSSGEWVAFEAGQMHDHQCLSINFVTAAFKCMHFHG